MINRWIPWKFLIKRAAKAYGILDPLTFLARIRQFSQPSEVQEPIELVRAGIIFHTRGLINTKAIQHNLDWIWPYWVERQFNPNDNSFIPRAFSFSHVNLTHRNWTAVGHPEIPLYPIIDPRGLTTPLYDGWSLDFWVLSHSGEMLLPSKMEDIEQEWILSPNLAVKTSCSFAEMALEVHAYLEIENDLPVLVIDAAATCAEGGWLVLALRPYNPEGIQFIETIEATEKHPGWLVNESTAIRFSRTPEKISFSNYTEGDVIHKLDNDQHNRTEISCSVGMATGAALFEISANKEQSVQTTIPLEEDLTPHNFFPAKKHHPQPVDDSWERVIAKVADLQVNDKKIQFLYDAAIRTLVLLSAEDVVPGPYTYRRFWFRDACLMLNSLMAVGLTDRVFALLDTFPARQKLSGYFQSQEGEWDSNGQVLWAMGRYQQITNHTFDQSWKNAIIKGANWIQRKRLRKKGVPHSGLLPAGFSAEHLGPNDYYYWDAFWSLAGLRSTARLAGLFISHEMQEKYEREALDLEKCIQASIDTIPRFRARGGIPASPYRRMDAGAIGSMVADYPLQITPPGDECIGCTLEFLMEYCFHKGAFFQDMIHSGTNIYLTLDLAQTLLRRGDMRYRQLLQTVAKLATSTGQWPEAIHPLTHGGCMGDGQHGWAAAEWVMMIRNLFVREEGDSLILGSGIFPEWMTNNQPLRFGPTPTLFGTIEINFRKTAEEAVLEVISDYSEAATQPASIIIDLPGYHRITTTDISKREFLLREL